jgi:hypothetical protein
MLNASALFFDQISYINLHGKNIPKPQKHPEFDFSGKIKQKCCAELQ